MGATPEESHLHPGILEEALHSDSRLIPQSVWRSRVLQGTAASYWTTVRALEAIGHREAFG